MKKPTAKAALDMAIQELIHKYMTVSTPAPIDAVWSDDELVFAIKSAFNAGRRFEKQQKGKSNA